VCIQHIPNRTQIEPASPHHSDQSIQLDHTAQPGHYLTPNPHPSRVPHVRTVEPPPILPNRATAASRSKLLVLSIGVATVMIDRRVAFVTISPPSRSTRHGPHLRLRERCQHQSRLRPELLLAARSSTLELLLINIALPRRRTEQIEAALD
jgi:hypothetical protein